MSVTNGPDQKGISDTEGEKVCTDYGGGKQRGVLLMWGEKKKAKGGS